jgi:hypothetical protein
VDIIHISRQPVANSVFAKGQVMRLAIQAEATDGSVLSYRWKYSPNSNLSAAADADGSGDADTRPVLTATAPASPGTYYYWVEVSRGDETVSSDAVEVVVVDRDLQTQLMNGDFQLFAGELSNPWQPGAWGQVPVDIEGRWGTLVPTTEPYVTLQNYLPYWDTTHYANDGMRKGIEMQNPTFAAPNAAGNGLDATGHANENRSDAEKAYTSSLPLIAELSGEARSSIYQDIATVPGKVYEWSIDHASEYGVGSMNYPDTLAVIIGPAINSQADYAADVTNRWTERAEGQAFSDALGVMKNAIPSGTYPYGTDTSTLFQDILVQTAINAGMPGDNNDEKVKALKNASGTDFVTEYNGGKYYVYVTTDPTSDTQWTHPSGAYAVPPGQGTTVFGFASVDSREPQTGNLLDNIVFKSGATPDLNAQISHAGDSSIKVTAKQDYAYALAELRGSSVYPLHERDVYVTPPAGSQTAASVNSSLGDGVSWYTPDANSELSFESLVPGKTYRLIGIPSEAVSADLGTNVSPADVLDEGYYADTTIKAGKDDLDDSGVGPNLSSALYNAGTAASPVYKGRVILAATDTRVEYALLTKDAANQWVPVAADGTTLDVNAADNAAGWTLGSGTSQQFQGLEPGREYRLIARPVGYTELTWQAVAAKEDSGVVKVKIPAVGQDITAAQVTRDSTASRDHLTLRGLDPNTYYLITDANTGAKVSYFNQNADVGLIYDPSRNGVTYQIQALIGGSFTQGVRVYPLPEFANRELSIDYTRELVEMNATTFSEDVEFRVDADGQNLITGGNADGYTTLSGENYLLLGKRTAYTSQPILDSISTSATVSYRMVVDDGYDGEYVQPVSTLSIPARPDNSTALDTVDWDAETVGGQPFADYGYTGLADRTLKVVAPATASSFASKPAEMLVKKRPAAPIGVTAEYDDANTRWKLHQVQGGKSYQYSPDNTTWAAVTQYDGTDAYIPDSALAFLRYAPDPANNTPGSRAIRVSDFPLVVEPLDFGEVDYGYATQDPQAVTIQNVARGIAFSNILNPVSVAIADVTRNGQPYTDQTVFDLGATTTGNLPKLEAWGIGDTPAPGSSDNTLFAVSVNSGLPAGAYSATLKLTYADYDNIDHSDGTAETQLTFDVEQVPWATGAITHTTELTSGNSIKAQVTGGIASEAVVEYSLDGVTFTPASVVDGSCEWTLSYAKKYQIWVRLLADDNHPESDLILLEPAFYTSYAAPAFADVLRINYASERLEFLSGRVPNQYSATAAGVPIAANGSLTGFADGGGGQITLVRQGADNPRVGPGSSTPVSESFAGRPTAPTPGDLTVTSATTQNNPNGSIRHVTSKAFEYRLKGAEGAWTSANSGNANGVAYGVYQVRLPATATAFASLPIDVSVGADKFVYQVAWTNTNDNLTITPPYAWSTGPNLDNPVVVDAGTDVHFGVDVTADGQSRFVEVIWNSGGDDVVQRADMDAIVGTQTFTYDLLNVNANQRVTVKTTGYYKRSVVFDANGGTGTLAGYANTVDNPSYAVTLPDATQFTREDYALAGWNTAADGSGAGYLPGGTYSMNVNPWTGAAQEKLYAQWQSLLPDKSELQDLVTNLAALEQAGLFKGYTADSVAKLDQAIKAAQVVLDTHYATQDQIDAALTALQTALAGLKSLSDPSDDSGDKVAELQTLVTAVEKLDKTAYTATSWNLVAVKLAAAKQVLAVATRTTAQVETAQQELLAAVVALKLHYSTEVRTQVKSVNITKKKGFYLAGLSYLTSGKTEKVTYKSSNSKVVKVSKTGKVTGVKRGTATITVTAKTAGADGKPLTTKVKVRVLAGAHRVTKVTAKLSKTLQVGAVVRLTPVLRGKYATPGKVSFKSSNTKVVKIDKTGKLTAKGKGTAKVAITAGGKKRVYKVTVK